MRTIERSTAFKRDYKRVRSAPRHAKDLDSLLAKVLSRLLADDVLAAAYRDHDLRGDWAGYRECHLKPDLLLIYRLSDAGSPRLARLGSHSELFG